MPKELDIHTLYQDLGFIIMDNYISGFLYTIVPPLPKLSVLEPGCGCAKLSISYALKGCDVDAFDIDRSMIEYGGRLLDAAGALTGNLFCQSMSLYISDFFDHMPKIPGNSYDLVFNEGVPHHFTDERRQTIINEMARVAKGVVIIIGNNGNNPEQIKRFKDVVFKYEGMPPQARFFTYNELADMMVTAGLNKVEVRPVLPVGTLELLGKEIAMHRADFIAGIGYK